MDYKQNFSNNILKLRKDNNLSLVTLGEILNISNQAVSLLEKGKNSPSFDVLCKTSDYFNVSIDFLVGKTDNSAINK